MQAPSRQSNSPGILLCNLGTPASPSVADVRKYLAEFLWDPRVVKTWRPLWWLILNFIILNTRPKRSALAYQKVWTEDGSPLLSISRRQASSLQDRFEEIPVELGMRYGEPSLYSSLDKLRRAGATEFVVLGLYPQFSHTTTSSVDDEVKQIVENFGKEYSYRLVHDYHSNPAYISALSQSIQTFWQEHGRAEKLLMSFHGIPQDYADDGDPYPIQCQETARLLAGTLSLDKDQWFLSYQSRLGPKQWLQPYTDKTLQEWGSSGVESVQVVCPGFSTDCLETLEEIAMENRDVFMESGGSRYEYIPCLNETPLHIDMMKAILESQLE